MQRKNKKNNIIRQMFDVRHAHKDGTLNLGKIKKVAERFSKPSHDIRGVQLIANDQLIDGDGVWRFEIGKNKEGIKVKRSLRSILQKSEREVVPSVKSKWKLFVLRGERSDGRVRIKNLGESSVPVFNEDGKQYLADRQEIFPVVEKQDRVVEKVQVKKERRVIEKKSVCASMSKIISVKEKSLGDYSIKNKKYLSTQIKNKKKFFHRGGSEGDCIFSWRDLFLPARFSVGFNLRKSLLAFTGSGFMAVTVIGGASFVDKGLEVKNGVMDEGNQAYENMVKAAEGIKNNDFESSLIAFENAQKNFSQASKDIEELGGVVVSASRYIPFASRLSSGKNLVEAGEYFASSGKKLNKVVEKLQNFKNIMDGEEAQNISLLEVFSAIQDDLQGAGSDLQIAKEKIEQVKADDLPNERRIQFIELKAKALFFSDTINEFLKNSHILVDLLGGNGPRKYLFLFQNSNEMRATGGFIGSYGLLEISSGKVQNFFIDGIFNPDGQLTEKIVPPIPIQKISAAWSLHDSNWFPNFPTSAEKAILFYEKTGGPTVDGVITLTPTVMEKLLTLVGPIEMPDYDVILTDKNFVEKTQYEVEVDYDKEENIPKKILSDLAPLVLTRLTNSRDPRVIAGALEALLGSLKEKHILLYSRNEQLQKMISQCGWSGEILQTQGDYVSVINSNINGYKTDGVVDEKISHIAEIQTDGIIIDTIEISRKHNGGNSEFDWWNKVNSDYMRVYVPQGAKLLEIEGQTVEFNDAPLDYQALKFDIDPDVKKEEEGMSVDLERGVRIYEDAGKTVFAFWTYVSPQEEVTIKLKYQLPFRVDFKENEASPYSLLAQKQSGSRGSDFSSLIQFPHEYNIEWKYPDESNSMNGKIEWNGKLQTDQFFGAVFLSGKVTVK